MAKKSKFTFNEADMPWYEWMSGLTYHMWINFENKVDNEEIKDEDFSLSDIENLTNESGDEDISTALFKSLEKLVKLACREVKDAQSTIGLMQRQWKKEPINECKFDVESIQNVCDNVTVNNYRRIIVFIMKELMSHHGDNFPKIWKNWMKEMGTI